MHIRFSTIKFDPHDMWIGIYWKTKWGFMPIDMYICIIPCFPIHLIITEVKSE